VDGLHAMDASDVVTGVVTDDAIEVSGVLAFRGGSRASVSRVGARGVVLSAAFVTDTACQAM
jgi:hypothetical protein